MKISITLSIEINAEQWMDYNGIAKKSDVRNDVKSYILNSIQGLAMVEEADGTVTIR